MPAPATAANAIGSTSAKIDQATYKRSASSSIQCRTGVAAPLSICVRQPMLADEFDAFLECGILAHGFSCKRRGFCPSCGARRMAQTAAHLVDHLIPRAPVRQWVLSFPIPLRILFAAHPALLTPVLQIIHRVIARFLIKQAGLKGGEAHTGAVTLIQRFGSAANLNIPCLSGLLPIMSLDESIAHHRAIRM